MSGGGFGGGGGSSANIFFATPSGSIAAATGPPGSGTPGGPLTGQNLYQISGGAFVAGPTGVSLLNGMESGVAATNTVACERNPDGTYSVIAQSCAS